ncbi:hypothetical protein PAXRUDRAFT_824001 [Paxillus rubicundulus Ve08.2h10]|uniref:Uncharacterized protein n=1 Tax=Paxillus rubicundulus Ve08.2h10 TaxID=930991 RepID=A0A0D0E2N8_9AGAM|nr:hypothetical protein PAXRUDRAFT_824001 [Paxillus rubicundulus Ve08.2h10]
MLQTRDHICLRNPHPTRHCLGTQLTVLSFLTGDRGRTSSLMSLLGPHLNVFLYINAAPVVIRVLSRCRHFPSYLSNKRVFLALLTLFVAG